MKNIHILPTDKPSRLSKQLDNPLVLYKQFIENRKFGKWSINQNIYITSDEEIKKGDWCYDSNGKQILQFNNRVGALLANQQKEKYGVKSFFKIILTTDQDLIKDGVQSIDDEFLEWFFNNPSCERVEITDLWREETPSTHDSYQIIIPKEEPKQQCKDCNDNLTDCTCIEDTIDMKQETLEEVVERLYPTDYGVKSKDIINIIRQDTFINGAKWEQERSYSEEEAYKIWKAGQEYWKTSGASITFEELIEQFKKK